MTPPGTLPAPSEAGPTQGGRHKQLPLHGAHTPSTALRSPWAWVRAQAIPPTPSPHMAMNE